jgi:TonB family protein
MVDSTGWIRAVQLVVPSEHPHIDLACLMAGVGGRMLPATLEGRQLWGGRRFQFNGIYPLSAQKKREEGDCVVFLGVNETGAIDGSRVLRSSGSNELDQACVDAASHVPFLPAKSDGRAIASETSLAMYWRLK